MTDYSKLREQMVDEQIAARGVRSDLVLDAMRKVPRERFVREDLREFAYEDSPLPIAANQTISQPYIVAFMIEGLALEGGEKVLEIGAGSGYSAAVLAQVAGQVYTIERIGELAVHAAEVVAELGYDNVEVIHADGTLGLPDEAPFDGIGFAEDEGACHGRECTGPTRGFTAATTGQPRPRREPRRRRTASPLPAPGHLRSQP